MLAGLSPLERLQFLAVLPLIVPAAASAHAGPQAGPQFPGLGRVSSAWLIAIPWEFLLREGRWAGSQPSAARF